VRNSIVPIVAAIVLFTIGAIAIRPNVSRGQGGPEVNAGILRLPKRNPLRTASAELAGSTAARLERGARDDGLWRVVVVAGDDREPTTRSAMLALGEDLFTAGMIAVMDPMSNASEPTPPLPIPADRVIRIATRDVAIGATPDAEWKATVSFSISDPRLPIGHPGEALQSAPMSLQTVVVVNHEGRPAAGGHSDWPTRWAATGRSLVRAMLGTALPPSGLRRPESHLAIEWGSPVPFPPTTPEMRWSGAFQYDLVRGWIGEISGRTVRDDKGRIEPAIAPLMRLLPRGTWEPVASDSSWKQWSRLRDGQQQWFAIRDVGDGWLCSMWCERPGVTELVTEWIRASRTGDTQAAEHLRRLLSAPALPETERLRIEQSFK